MNESPLFQEVEDEDDRRGKGPGMGKARAAQYPTNQYFNKPEPPSAGPGGGRRK